MGSNPTGLSAWLVPVSASVASLVATAANLAALVWFGFWMGLSSRNTNTATLKTLLFVQVIPAFVLGFASMFLTALLMIPTIASPNTTGFNQGWSMMGLILLPALLAVAKDVLFISWSRRKLYGGFREIASRPMRVGAPVPPIIPATILRTEPRPAQP